MINAAQVTSTGTGQAGSIMINGSGSTGGGNSNVGVYIVATSTTVSSTAGPITVNGTGASGGLGSNNLYSSGAIVSGGASVVGTGLATVVLNGTAANSADPGVYLNDAGATVSTVSGNLAIVGTSVGGGVVLANSSIVATTGNGTNGPVANIAIDGTDTGSGLDADGVRIQGGGVQVTTAGGNIAFDGQGGTDRGMILGTSSSDSSDLIAASGAGGVSLTGVLDYAGYDGSSLGYMTVSTQTGPLTVSGTSTGGTGLYIYSGADVTSSDGPITVTGQGLSTGTSTIGVALVSGAKIASTAAGGAAPALTVNGTSPDSSGVLDYGGAISSVDAPI